MLNINRNVYRGLFIYFKLYAIFLGKNLDENKFEFK